MFLLVLHVLRFTFFFVVSRFTFFYILHVILDFFKLFDFVELFEFTFFFYLIFFLSPCSNARSGNPQNETSCWLFRRS